MELRFFSRWTTVAAAVAALAVAGCATTETPSSAGSSGTGSEFRDDPLGSEAPRDVTGSEVTGSMADLGSSLGPVYFDYDRFNIRDDAKAALASNAKAIKDNAGWGVVTIEGHCDERGSEEYNIALGELRARAVKQYLSDLGVSSGRLDVVSFGEAKPAVMGHDESAWRYNRRSEFSGGR
jgi:peptidoglycan-associated lipoprotein